MLAQAEVQRLAAAATERKEKNKLSQTFDLVHMFMSSSFASVYAAFTSGGGDQSGTHLKEIYKELVYRFWHNQRLATCMDCSVGSGKCSTSVSKPISAQQ